MDALDLSQGFGSRGSCKVSSMRRNQELPSCPKEMTTAGQSWAGGTLMKIYLRAKIMYISCEKED